MITISATPRVAACPTSAVLPAVVDVGPRPERDHGTAVHRFLQLVSEVGREAALELIEARYRPVCEAIDTDKTPAGKPGQFAAEVAFAYNWNTGQAREIGRGLDRAYESLYDPATEIAGATDSVGLYREADVVIVDDYKTGWADLGDVSNNWQLKTLGLVAARAYGVSNAEVGIVRFRNGEPWYQRATLGELDLDLHEAALRTLLNNVARLKTLPPSEVWSLPLNEGPHCRYCPAFERCPAKTTLVQALAMTAKQHGGTAPELSTAGQARLALEQYRLATELLERVKMNIDAYAAREPIDLGNGRVYGPVDVETRYLKADQAVPLVEVWFGEEVARAATETRVVITQERLKDALRPYVKEHGKQLGKTLEETMERLEKADAIEVKHRTDFKVHRPKQLLEG